MLDPLVIILMISVALVQMTHRGSQSDRHYIIYFVLCVEPARIRKDGAQYIFYKEQHANQTVDFSGPNLTSTGVWTIASSK